MSKVSKDHKLPTPLGDGWISKDLNAIYVDLDKARKEAYERGRYDGAREWAKAQAMENSTMYKSCVMPCCLCKTIQPQGNSK